MLENYTTQFSNNVNGIVLYEEINIQQNQSLPPFLLDVYTAVFFATLSFFIIAVTLLFFVVKKSRLYYLCVTMIVTFIEIVSAGIVYQIAKFGIAKAFLNQGWFLLSIFAFIVIVVLNALFVFSLYTKKESK